MVIDAKHRSISRDILLCSVSIEIEGDLHHTVSISQKIKNACSDRVKIENIRIPKSPSKKKLNCSFLKDYLSGSFFNTDGVEF